MGMDKQINLAVGETQKTQWKNAVADHPEAETLSHLIRLAVSHELADQDQPESDSPGSTDDLESAIQSEVAGPLRSIKQEIEQISDQIDAIDREAASDANYDLQQVVLETLPTPPDDHGPVSPRPTEFAVSADEIAGRIGAETSDVSDALDHLDEVTSIVQSGLASDGVLWYKKE